MSRSVTSKVTELAKLQRARGAGMGILATLALELAEAAKSGEVNADDAMDLYLHYARTATGIKTLQASDPTIKVNASKLRQIIKARDPALLQRVIAMNNTVVGGRLYATMVNVCRLRLTTGRKPSDAQIKRLLTE